MGALFQIAADRILVMVDAEIDWIDRSLTRLREESQTDERTDHTSAQEGEI
jgi:hypothetical protein